MIWHGINKPNRKEQVSDNKVNTPNFQLTYRYTFTYKSY